MLHWRRESLQPWRRCQQHDRARPVVIRLASPQDLDLLEEIENDADSLFIERFQPEQWWPASSREERAASPGFILIAADDGLAVGFVHVLESDGVAHLEQLSVKQAAARRGLGRALVEAAKAEASRRGYGEMTLRTYADVPWNAPFHATVGFRPSEPATLVVRASALEPRAVALTPGRGSERGHAAPEQFCLVWCAVVQGDVVEVLGSVCPEQLQTSSS